MSGDQQSFQAAAELAFDVLEFIERKTTDRAMQAATVAIALGMLLGNAPDLEAAAEYFKRMIIHTAKTPELQR